MSYDLCLNLPACEHCKNPGTYVSVEYDSPTYNYGQMIRECDRLGGGDGYSFDAVDGLTGEEAEPWFRRVYEMAVKHRGKVQAMEPDNGWGDYEGLLKIFRSYASLSIENPGAIWSQCGTSPTDGKTCTGRKMVESKEDKARRAADKARRAAS